MRFLVAAIFLLYAIAVCYGGNNMITKEEKAAAVDTHNEHRRKTNAKMLKMKWNEALAKFAEEQASKCNFEHSKNRQKIAGFDYTGENIYVNTAKPTMKQVVDDWASELKDYSYASNKCNPGAMCGHYTQVVWHTSGEVGCAMVQCGNVQGFGHPGYLVFCNYGPGGNYEGQKPYVQNANCKQYTAMDDQKTGLCLKMNMEDGGANIDDGGESNSGNNKPDENNNNGNTENGDDNGGNTGNTGDTGNTVTTGTTTGTTIGTTGTTGKPGTTGNNTGNSGDNKLCKDKITYCKDLQHTCRTSEAMKYWCPTTCGYCKGTTPAKPGCVDGFRDCHVYLKSCYKEDWMKWHCAKSCRFCK